MKYFLLWIPLLILQLQANTFTLTIEGTGDSQELLRGLAKVYEVEHQDMIINIPNSIGSSGGIKKVIENKLVLARVARKLKYKEKKEGVKYLLFAYSPVVFVVNANNKKNYNISSSDILKIFKGDIESWENIKGVDLSGKIYVVNRELGDSSLSILQKNFYGFDKIEKFTGIIANYNSEAINLITKYKNTIGYLSLANTMNTSLNILSIDGISPSMENIKTSKYKYLTPFGFAYKGELTKESKKFLKFLNSKSAKEYMISHGVIPSK